MISLAVPGHPGWSLSVWASPALAGLVAEVVSPARGRFPARWSPSLPGWESRSEGVPCGGFEWAFGDGPWPPPAVVRAAAPLVSDPAALLLALEVMEG